MARYLLEVCYDGTAFHGSQLQGDIPTVQLAINKALTTLLREDIISWGSSRTDEGVHAFGNFYHFDFDGQLHDAFQYKLNAILPPAISVPKVYVATNQDFNARFDAISRQYRYRIYNSKNPFLVNRALYYPYRLDIDALHKTSAILKEYENFETFSKRNTQTRTFMCKIMQSYWQQVDDELQYIVEANRFLRGMVRGLVGTQLQVARGRMSIDDFRDIIEARDCTKADFSVTGHGLYLERVVYPAGLFTERKDNSRQRH